VIDLDHAYFAPVAAAIRRDVGFEPIFDHLAIFGWCRSCQEESEVPDMLHGVRGEGEQRVHCSL
jgi:hypothetical protein